MKKKSIMLLAAEAVIVLIFLLPLFQSLEHYEYDFGEMAAFTDLAEITEDGYYIDEDSGYTGIFTYKPYFTLGRGSYRITVRYEATAAGNTCVLNSNSDKSFHALRCEEILLSPNLESVTFSAYFGEKIEAVNLITSYNGEGGLLLKSVSIDETHETARVDLLITVLVIAAVNVILYSKKTGLLERIATERKNVFCILLAAVLFVSYPLFTLGLTRGSDLVFHLLRIEGLKDGLLSGTFPVRIQPTWMEGYGYAVSVFYGDLLLYFPAALRLIGFSVQGAYKIFLFAVNIATCLTAYYCLGRILKDRYISAFGSILYLTAPYRLYGTYVVSRVGESLALIFIPLVVSGLYEIFTKDIHDKDYRKCFIAPTAGFIGLINSHVLTTQIVAGFTLLVCVLCIRRVFRRETFLELLKTAGFSMLISAAFIIPFLDYYLGYEFHVNSSQESQWIQAGGLQLNQLFQVFPSYNEDIASFTNLNYTGIENAGIAVTILAAVFIYAVVILQSEERKKLNKMWLIYGLGIFTAAAATCYFPWDSIREQLEALKMEVIIDSIQRPTRFMPVAAILLIVAGLAALKVLLEKKETADIGRIVLWGCVILTIITAGYYNNYVINNKEQETITDLNKFEHVHTWSRGEYLPPDTDTSYLTSIGAAAGENIEISDYTKEYLDIRFAAVNSSDQTSYVDLPLVYYGGYMAYDDEGNELKVYNGHNNNVVRVDIPAGFEGKIHVYFREPVLWRISEVISAVSGLSIIGYYVYTDRRKNRWVKTVSI